MLWGATKQILCPTMSSYEHDEPGPLYDAPLPCGAEDGPPAVLPEVDWTEPLGVQIRQAGPLFFFADRKGLGDAGVAELAAALYDPTHPAVVAHLSVCGNDITDAGAVALAQAVQGSHTLRKLHVEHNVVTAVGAHALAEALKHNRTVAELYLYGNKIGSRGVAHLADALHVRCLLQGCWGWGRSVL